MNKQEAEVDVGTTTMRKPQKRGEKRAADIVATARQILESDQNENITFRAIAKKLGIYVRNVSYYYPNKSILVGAILEDIRKEYDAEVSVILEQAGDNPVERLRASVEFYIAKIQIREVQILARKMHAELAMFDNYTGKYFSHYVAQPYVRRFVPLISECMPYLSKQEIEIRANMIGGLFEGVGLILSVPEDDISSKQNRDILDRCAHEAMRIALSPT